MTTGYSFGNHPQIVSSIHAESVLGHLQLWLHHKIVKKKHKCQTTKDLKMVKKPVRCECAQDGDLSRHKGISLNK
jgi:hypothetical protein